MCIGKCILVIIIYVVRRAHFVRHNSEELHSRFLLYQQYVVMTPLCPRILLLFSVVGAIISHSPLDPADTVAAVYVCMSNPQHGLPLTPGVNGYYISRFTLNWVEYLCWFIT